MSCYETQFGQVKIPPNFRKQVRDIYLQRYNKMLENRYTVLKIARENFKEALDYLKSAKPATKVSYLYIPAFEVAIWEQFNSSFRNAINDSNGFSITLNTRNKQQSLINHPVSFYTGWDIDEFIEYAFPNRTGKKPKAVLKKDFKPVTVRSLKKISGFPYGYHDSYIYFKKDGSMFTWTIGEGNHSIETDYQYAQYQAMKNALNSIGVTDWDTEGEEYGGGFWEHNEYMNKYDGGMYHQLYGTWKVSPI